MSLATSKSVFPFRLPSSLDEKTGNSAHLDETINVLQSMRYFGLEKKKPWLDDHGNIMWTKTRIRIGQIVCSQRFESIMGLIVVGNLILIMIEADRDAQCLTEYKADVANCPYRSDRTFGMRLMNILLLTIYSLEMFARVFVERWLFFCNKFNMVDLVTVMLGWSSVAFAGMVNLSWLRLARLVRVLRAVRIFVSIPEFYLLITGLYSSLKAILFGSAMLLSVVVFWAVISVEVLHPVVALIEDFDGCDRCPRSFSNVFEATVTIFQQTVAGDSWGEVSLKVIDAEPLTFILLFVMLMTISLGVMNLILAVIVETAAQARENDRERKTKQKEEERVANMVELAVFCANLDKDNDGCIGLLELSNGYETPEFRTLMEHVDIKKDEMEQIFRVLDDDEDGSMSYLNFCQKVGGFFKRDPLMMQSIIQVSIKELKKIIHDDVVATMRQQHEDHMHAVDEIMTALGIRRRRRHSLETKGSAKNFYRWGPPTMADESKDDTDADIPRHEDLAQIAAQIEHDMNGLLATAESFTNAVLAPTSTAVADGWPDAIYESAQDGDGCSHANIDQMASSPGLQDGVDAQYRAMNASLRKRAEEAELLQSRLRDALQCLVNSRQNEPTSKRETTTREI
ncbi:Scn11a [Symbiodinium pilosum]|uniref:Scn11a protein n=1 Tax=Symbiodinium pilosum TaxID=2952 RepID=A0A812Y380_SYMPI|nr:Scn11a [Symbiodinium pilosum]